MAVPVPKDVFYRYIRRTGMPAARPMDRKLLDILVCPATRQPLSLLGKPGLAALNGAIAADGLARADGTPQSEPLREALVTRDHRLVYRVDDGIPVLLAEEGIPTAQVADFPKDA